MRRLRPANLFRSSEVSICLDKIRIVAFGAFPLCHEVIDFALVPLEIGLEKGILDSYWVAGGFTLTFLSLRFLIVFFIGSR